MSQLNGILETIRDGGYQEKLNGFVKVTENNTHWITLFEDSQTLQMYAYFSEDPEFDSIYDTGIIDVTFEELNVLISIFTTSHK